MLYQRNFIYEYFEICHFEILKKIFVLHSKNKKFFCLHFGLCKCSYLHTDIRLIFIELLITHILSL